MIKRTESVLYDETTGEVYNGNVKESKSRLWEDGKGAILKPRNYHCKIYQDVRLCDIIENKQDLLRTYILTEHIYKNTNIVYIQKENNIYKPANVSDISIILDMCERRTKDYISRMKKIGIIAEMTMDIQGEKYISFIFNPIYVNSCRYISNEMYLLFKPYLDKNFPKWIVDKYSEVNQRKNFTV